MSYLKFAASFLFDGYQLHQNKILITDENGTVENIMATEDTGNDVVPLKGILCPGFINCHCHLELSHLRGAIPEKTGLVDFVFAVVTKRNFEEARIVEAIETAEAEMMRNGIVAVGDICNNTITFSQKQKQNLAYYNFVEVSGWLPQVAQTRVNNALQVYDVFNQLSPFNHHTSAIKKHQTSIVPHAPYSVSDELWWLLQPFFQHKTISIHNQETHFEDELFIQGSGDFTRMYRMMNMDNSFFSPAGKSSLQTYFPKLKAAQNIVLVHNTFTNKNDVLYANEQAASNGQNLFWCLCVNANLYIENAVPPVEMLVKNNCNIVLGTDSLASNRSLNMLDEMKTLQQYFPFLTKAQLLQFATSNGAKALNMNDTLGSFERGKQPGVLLLNNDLTEVKRLL